MDFEWNEAKRQANIDKHGIDFLDARQLFDGRPRYDIDSPRGDEPRILSIGELDGEMTTVIWTLRGENICRIISVRRARNEEKRQYSQVHG
jgi:uncharacterized DUF497 family protein